MVKTRSPLRADDIPYAHKDPEAQELYVRIGDRIRQLREMSGITQKQLAAEVLGAEHLQPNISRWERGEVMPQLATLYRIARFFGVSLAGLGVYEPDEAISDAEIRRAREHLEAALSLLTTDPRLVPAE